MRRALTVVLGLLSGTILLMADDPPRNPSLGSLGALARLAKPSPPPGQQPQEPLIQPLVFFNPYKVEDRVYKNQQINVDGYSFKNCAFINCTITTSKGNFHFD